MPPPPSNGGEPPPPPPNHHIPTNAGECPQCLTRHSKNNTPQPIDQRNDQKFCINPLFNTLRPRQNGRHFADNIFKCIFLNEDAQISLKISLKFVPKARINNIPALVQIMAWRRPGNKPLSEPMMVSLPTHICVTRPQWVKSSSPGQDGRCFADNIFKCIFSNEKSFILISVSLNFVPKGPIDNNPALV